MSARNSFIESIRCNDDVIAATVEAGRNHRPDNFSKTGNSGGGWEIGDDGAGSLGRTPDYKGDNSMRTIDKLTSQTDTVKEQGDEIIETGETKLEGAGEMKSAIDSLEALDEDAQEIIDTATEGAQEVASEQAESAIMQPMEGVNEGLTEVTNEATESADIEHQNADTISDAVGDYGSVSSQAESSFEQHASEIESVGDNAQEINDEFRDRSNEMKDELDSFFG